MRARFGPWSSALGDGLAPRLSSFWKRRLALLASARAAPSALNRRDWLKLGALAASASALPTLDLALAQGRERARPAATSKIYVQGTFKLGPGGSDDGGIFAIDPSTAAMVKVVDFQGSASLSPDGRTFALMRAGRTGADFHEIPDVGLWTLSADGKGERRRIADFGGVISWSPDSKQLIVAKWLYKPGREEMRHENWRLNVDGSGATKLAIPNTDEVDGWSPDGQWLVTTSDRHPPHGSGYQLYLMHPDGTGERRLTEDHGLNVYPRFSPDGRQIAYLHQEHGQNSLWIVNIDGSGRQRVVQEKNDSSPDGVCWSPDGKSLAYILEDWQRDENNKKVIVDPEKSHPRIAIIDVEGKESRPVNLPRAIWLGGLDWR